MYFLLWEMKEVDTLRQFIQIASAFTAGRVFKALTMIRRQNNIFEQISQALFSNN